jgi:hypothetical protein
MYVMRGYLFIKPGFEPGLEPGLDSGFELEMTSGDFDGWKFTNNVLTFKELSLDLDYSFTNNAKCLRKFKSEEMFIDNLRNVSQMGSDQI